VGRILPPDARLRVFCLPLLQRAGLLALAVLAGLFASGCAQNEIGRYTGYYVPVIANPQRVRNAIVKSENYWIQKEVAPQEEFPGPTPDDLKPSEADYILGPGDLVDVTVFELMAPGQPYVTRLRISQSGQISFPYLNSVKCVGLTTRGLEEKLADLLMPDYLANPQVSVFVSEYRNLNVSVLNGVARPGLYPMTKQDMSLLELVAMSGGILQLTEDYGYVIRKYAPEEADLLALEAGTPPEEAARDEKPAPGKATKTGENASTEKPEAPTPATPGAMTPEEPPPEAAPKPPEKTPEKAPKAPEKATNAPEKAAPKPPQKPAAEPKKEESAAPAAEGAPAKAAAKPAEKPSVETAKDARELLEKMAAGEMPSVQKIEKAEVAAVQKPVEPKPEAPKAETPAPKPAPADAAALAKDEKELGRWIWSDGKWVEVKDKSSAEAKPAGAKPAEAKPAVAAKPAETKPAEAKPAVAAKPAETKPAEAKPAVAAKPAETKPAEAKPGEAMPAEEKPAVAAKPPEETPEADAATLEKERGKLEEKLRRLGVVQGAGQLRRIIRFDVKALQSGDPTQNVVLRDGDVVTIPAPLMGDFYMAGEVARPGVYSLTGRKITLLQAIAAAGGLSAVAVPWRTEVIRRISETEEEIIYVDISLVARGEVPDFYVQPEDLIRVGTDQGAIYNAVHRNAYRATYGVGAVYDTNFAEFYPWSLARKGILGGS